MDAGTPRKPVWLPPELLFIVKGQRRLKLDERQVRLIFDVEPRIVRRLMTQQLALKGIVCLCIKP